VAAAPLCGVAAFNMIECSGQPSGPEPSPGNGEDDWLSHLVYGDCAANRRQPSPAPALEGLQTTSQREAVLHSRIKAPWIEMHNLTHCGGTRQLEDLPSYRTWGRERGEG
jgi:hypothetical protein